MTPHPAAPSRRTLLRALTAVPASAVLLGEIPGLLGSALAAAPPNGSATRYTIVPFLNSDDGTVDVYQSDDATDFRLLRSSAYTPPANRIRDASVIRHTDGFYYLTYTTHTWQDPSTTIGFARSSDRAGWTFLYDYTVPIANLSRAWAPEWFVDSDGSVNIIVSCSTANDEWIFTPYRLRATNSALTAWSSPVALSGIGANHIDTFIVKTGATYHAFPKNETTKYIEYATASNLTGPYTIRRTGDWAGWGSYREGPALVQLDNGAGLADGNGCSFRDAAGEYLRHWDFRARFDADNGTSTFAEDATFFLRAGTSSGSVRFESYNYPGYYLRHYAYQLRVERSDGTDQFRQDSSFTPVTPWA